MICCALIAGVLGLLGLPLAKLRPSPLGWRLPSEALPPQRVRLARLKSFGYRADGWQDVCASLERPDDYYNLVPVHAEGRREPTETELAERARVRRTFEAAVAAFALVTSGLRAMFKSFRVLDGPSESSYKNLRNRRHSGPKTSP